MNPKIALFGHKIPKADLDERAGDLRQGRVAPERYELNLYVSGYDEDDEPEPVRRRAKGAQRR